MAPQMVLNKVFGDRQPRPKADGRRIRDENEAKYATTMLQK